MESGPAAGVADAEHGIEDGVPGGRVFEGAVGEHAAIPADMPDTAFCSAFEPVLGAFDDVEFTVGIIGRAMFAGLVVGPGTVNLAIILSNVEVDCPRPQFVGHGLVGRPEFRVRVAGLDKCAFGGVIAEQVEVGVSEVCLEAERLRHADFFEEVKHVLPAVHSGPADFAFGRQSLPVVRSDLCGFTEGAGDF
ncbi:MAG: hypothetical protein RLZZ436_2331 [Planctomycetota bacterium]